MSSHAGAQRRLTVPELIARKGGTPLVALTAATAPFAAIADPHVDLLLVGDSLGMVLHGLDSTMGVTLEMMILHGAAVVRGSSHALVAVDMPFASYEESPEQAFRNAARMLAETGAQAVKLEGGVRMAETVAFLTRRGVPVLGHVGLTPQSALVMGGFRTQGRDEASWPAHVEDARAVAEAGAFALVVEGVVEPLAARITEAVAVPTIGIGASPRCDGQILVLEDMLGLTTGRVPKFVRRFADLAGVGGAAIADYAAAVREGRFPAEEHLYR